MALIASNALPNSTQSGSDSPSFDQVPFSLPQTRCIRLLALGVAAIGLASAACAQQPAKVTVSLDKEINILTSASLGAPAKLYDGNSFNLDEATALKFAGLTTVRFPATNADVYHWSTDKATPYKGADPAYLAPGSDFGNVAALMDKTGSGLIVVNYGTNADGTGGGEPAEAAAWVAYANGDPSSTDVIGKDSTGHDWQTVGYWATLRTQAKLPSDDGMNFLRISRPSPLKIRLWQIGSQTYYNGFYGADHAGEPDLHAPSPSGPKDFAKLRKQPNLSPAYFGDRVTEFAKAMKAVDPTIQIGVSAVRPPDDLKWAPDWNAALLKHACKDIDFVTLEMVVGNTLPPDYKTLDEANALTAVPGLMNGLLNGVLYDDKANCPAGHIPRIAFNPAGLITWSKYDHPVALGLWTADTYALLVESGSANVTTPDMYSDQMISPDRKKFGAVYYGLQMFHIAATSPGDTFVDAKSNNPKLAIHAIKRRNGFTALMLINKDPSAPITAKISIPGAAASPRGFRFDYGAEQQKAGTGFVKTDFKDGGPDFTVTIPPYTITDILMAK